MTRHYSVRRGHHPDYVLLGSVLLLVLVGFAFLASASFDIGKLRYDDAYYFLFHQLINGLIPGLVLFIGGYFLYYRKWRKVAPLLFLGTLVLLLLVFTPLGFSAHGSHRWLTFGSFSFQPSELLKITFIAYLASLFSSAAMRRLQSHKWTTYAMFIGVSGLVGGLILLQPATTMAVIIIGAGAVIYFFSGASWKHVIATLLLGVVVVTMLAFITPYRFSRLAPFWNGLVDDIAPSLQVDDSGVDRFHLDQSLLSVGTGGLFGVGYGKSTSKYSILPEPMGDSIFAVIAEEIGFVGGMIIILAYAVLFWRATMIARRSRDHFGALFALGIGSVIAIQTIIHIAANTGVLPFTGIPLPFISYGGTSFAISLGMVGILANISRYTSSK